MVNGAPIYAAASGLSGARKPPPVVVDMAIESKDPAVSMLVLVVVSPPLFLPTLRFAQMLGPLLETKSLRFENIATRLKISTRATAPRAAMHGGRPRSLRVRPRAADWRTQGRYLQNPTSTLFHTLHT